jgi:hypothetical protein
MRKTGSWIIVDKETGLPAIETFCEAYAETMRSNKDCEVLTALEWLTRFNTQIKEQTKKNG